jgi:hypothetical protein
MGYADFDEFAVKRAPLPSVLSRNTYLIQRYSDIANRATHYPKPTSTVDPDDIIILSLITETARAELMRDIAQN